MSKNCDHENGNGQEKLFSHNYPGLNFKFNINDLPKEYLGRLGNCMTACTRITSLLSKYKISKRQMIHLTMWSDPISTVWLDRHVDEEVKQKYRDTKAQNVLNLYNEVSAIADKGEKIPFTIDDIFKYHKKLLVNIPQDPSRPSGQYRKGWMKVTRDGKDIIVGTCCKEVPAYMERLFYWLDSEAFKSDKGSFLGNAFIKAIVAHMYFVSIHPFYDGNGSIARLLQYAILRNAGVSGQIAHLLANYYNETRKEYLEAANAARASGDVTIFLDYALKGLSDKLNAYLKELLQNFPETIRERAKEQELALAKGFTILEILVVLAVLAILIGMAVPRIKGMQDLAGSTRAQADIKTVQTAVEAYKMTTGEYPPPSWDADHGGLNVLATTTPQLITMDNLQDPWGGVSKPFHNYQLSNPGMDTRYYLIQSRGPLVRNSNGDSCYIILDTPTGTPTQPAECQCIFVTNAPVASMTLEER